MEVHTNEFTKTVYELKLLFMYGCYLLQINYAKLNCLSDRT